MHYILLQSTAIFKTGNEKSGNREIGESENPIFATQNNSNTQPRKPGSFTSARRYSKDPGALWSRDLLKIRTTRGPRGGWLKCDML